MIKMVRGNEHVRVSLKSIFQFIHVKMVILGIICLVFYLHPQIFPNGFPTWGLLVIIFIIYGIDVGASALVYGLFGIQEDIVVIKEKK